MRWATPWRKSRANCVTCHSMEDDMGLNGGTILDSEETVQEVNDQILGSVARVAGGEQSAVI